MYTATAMLGGYGLRADDVRGVTRIVLESRLTRLQGFHACCWLVGDILIDAGFVKAAPLLLDFLDGKRVRAVACTHHHEDHTGGAGLVAERHRCPVYLNRPEERFSEGLGDMKPYRRIWWGRPAEYEPEQMPERLGGEGLELTCVPTPGHSVTHCAFFEPEGGVLFSGDLYIAPGATAIMSHENPYLLADSLKRVAELEPRYMMTGHGLVMKGPAGALRQKAAAIEEAAARAVEMFERGMAPRQIERELFSGGRTKDRLMAWFTQGEFSRRNFVAAAIRHSRGRNRPRGYSVLGAPL